ncbi:hypothetical protein DFJ77DRAFT_173862 [Powellomyces hirtus]|nr:hypothetical protein DFJ77DRAFT_173862 [Powellomyces hirtus]
MGSTVYLHALVASTTRYRVFSVKVDTDVPLTELRIHVATRLGFEANSWNAGAFSLYRIDEDILEDDKRLLESDEHHDPSKIFQLVALPDSFPESLQDVNTWIPEISDKSKKRLHLLVQLPRVQDEDTRWDLQGRAGRATVNSLPPAYTANGRREADRPSSAFGATPPPDTPVPSSSEDGTFGKWRMRTEEVSRIGTHSFCHRLRLFWNAQ